MSNRIASIAREWRWRIVVVVAIALGAVAATSGIGSHARIDFLTVTGDLDAAQVRRVEERLAELVGRIDGIEPLKAALEAEDWVYRADVAFRWPNELAVHVVPQRPIAYWNDAEFINEDGAVFHTEQLSPGDLPQLYGPAGSEEALMDRYRLLARVLADTGREIDELRMNDRGGVEFRTRDGVAVNLGNVDVNARLARVLRVMGSGVSDIVRMDARYATGIAVLRREPGDELLRTADAGLSILARERKTEL